eukprot:4277823-Pyramimonas_sp.AAC.1
MPRRPASLVVARDELPAGTELAPLPEPGPLIHALPHPDAELAGTSDRGEGAFPDYTPFDPAALDAVGVVTAAPPPAAFPDFDPADLEDS